MASKGKSNRKGSSKAEQAVAAEGAGIGGEEQEFAGKQPAATVAPAAPSTPQQKKGKSTLAMPVAVVWAYCINAIASAKAEGKSTPARKDLVNGCIANGVAYYTARTQVQAYLKASGNGAHAPAKLPRGLNLNPQA